MSKPNLILAFVLFLTCSFTAAASDIYKRVNEDGVVEYSDRPSSDGDKADKIEVRPNVVVTNPVTRSTPAASASSSRDNARSKNQPQKAVGEKNREEEKSEVVTDQDPGRATRNAVRALSGRPR